MIRILLTAPLFFLGAHLSACRLDEAPASSTKGSSAPAIAWTSVNADAGKSLADLRGRVVLLEFWRTW